MKIMESLLGSAAIATAAIVLGATPVLAHTAPTPTPSEMVTADGASWHATVSGAELFDRIEHPAVRSCVTAIRSCPTAADLTVTLALTRGSLRFGIESITAVAAGDGLLNVDAVLDVDDATGSGGGWVISQDGLGAVQTLQLDVDCLQGSSCSRGRSDDRMTSAAGHPLFAAQPNTGMGPQRVHVLLHTVAAVQDHWSFSIAPPAIR
jgi:hypothetical protein